MFDYRMPEKLKQTTSCRFNIFRDYPVFDREKGEEPKRENRRITYIMIVGLFRRKSGQTENRRPTNKSFLELRIEKWGSEVGNKPF